MNNKQSQELDGQMDIFGGVHTHVVELKKTNKPKAKATQDEKLAEFNKMIDHDPPETWVKVNKNFDNSKYLPIRIVEALLKSVFGAYQVKEASPIRFVGDNVIYSVYLVVWHPILKDWLYFSGVGAAPLRSDEKGISIALHGNAPMARAFAVTNAAKSIGRLFGSALNNLEDEMIDVYDPEFKAIKKSKGSVGDLLKE